MYYINILFVDFNFFIKFYLIFMSVSPWADAPYDLVWL